MSAFNVRARALSDFLFAGLWKRLADLSKVTIKESRVYRLAVYKWRSDRERPVHQSHRAASDTRPLDVHPF